MTTAVTFIISQQPEGWEVSQLWPRLRLEHYGIDSVDNAIALAEREAERYPESAILIVDAERRSRLLKRSVASIQK